MQKLFSGEKISEFMAELIENQLVTGMIFDADGTLLDSMPVWDHCAQHYLSNRGITAQDGLEKILYSMTMEQGAAYIQKAYGLPESVSQLISGINETALEAYQGWIQPKPGMLTCLEALNRENIPVAVVTNSDRPLVMAAFERLGMAAYFDLVMTCSEFGSGKDRPEIFYAAASRIGSPVNTTWVADDALYAVRTAKAAGFRVIGCADASNRIDESEIRRLADYFV